MTANMFGLLLISSLLSCFFSTGLSNPISAQTSTTEIRSLLNSTNSHSILRLPTISNLNDSWDNPRIICFKHPPPRGAPPYVPIDMWDYIRLIQQLDNLPNANVKRTWSEGEHLWNHNHALLALRVFRNPEPTTGETRFSTKQVADYARMIGTECFAEDQKFGGMAYFGPDEPWDERYKLILTDDDLPPV